MIKEAVTTALLLLSNPQMECLTEAIYFEGRGEPPIGQLAIAQVIINRVQSERYPDNICGVVRNCQFSYYCDGKHERMVDKAAQERAYNIAKLAVNGIGIPSLVGATHYHATYVQPKWSYVLEYLGQIGMHKFYKEG